MGRSSPAGAGALLTTDLSSLTLQVTGPGVRQVRPSLCSIYPADTVPLKVHKIEIFFGSDFEICIISLLVMSKY